MRMQNKDAKSTEMSQISSSVQSNNYIHRVRKKRLQQEYPHRYKMCMGKNTTAQQGMGRRAHWEEHRSSKQGMPQNINKQEDSKQGPEKVKGDKEQMAGNK